MFLKPFRIKSQTNTKGSDRKKIRLEISQQYPMLADDDLALVIPQKEDMSTMKIYTHSGNTALVYIVNKNPIFFQLDKSIFPTVYTLWKWPLLMPVLATWPPVFSKLENGADLMLPGVVVKGDINTDALGNMEKGDACCVKLVGNKAPVAVGRSALSSSDMIDAGMRGKGVRVIHTFHDQLWALGDKSSPPLLEDEEFLQANTIESENGFDVEKATEDDTELKDVVEGMDSVEITGAETSKQEDSEADNDKPEASAVDENGEISASGGNEAVSEENPEEEEIDPQQIKDEMDSLLVHCFMCSLKTNVKKGDLPLLTSKFFRNHLLPYCPKDKSIDVKKSSYKKLSKFLQEMQKRGFIKVKELSKGVESIVEIQKDHPEIRSYVVEPLEESGACMGEGGALAEAENRPPQIAEMVMVTGNTATIFKLYGIRNGTALSMSEMRQTLTNYIKENELTTQSNRVTLDGNLSDLLLQKGEYIEELAWDQVFSRCQNKLSPAYSISVAGQKPVIKKGKPTPVSLNIATRAGNKKVTLVENLEQFGISPEELAHKVQVGVACSTTVTPLPGKNKGAQVLVQGNQINYIADLLLDFYKLPKKWISGLEKAPKSGKKNR